MIKWIPSKIGAKLLITFSAVLLLSMVSLIYVATQMVGKFGEFSASINEANIRDNANAFMARITHEQAMRYESTFEKLALSSALVAKRAAFFLENMTLYGKMPLKPNEKLVIYPHNGIFSNDRSERTMVLYWGSPAMSPGINEQINTLSHLDPLLETVKEVNPESVACYVVTERGISRYYPNIHGVEKLPPTTKFDIRNANWYVIAKPENNPECKTVWSNIYLDSVGQGLLTTASTPLYSKSGQYVGAAGIDITLDTIVKDILEHISSGHRMEGMFSFLVDNQGRIIAFPQEYLGTFGIKIDQNKLVDPTVILKHSLLDSPNAEIKKIGKSMLEKKYQVSRLILDRQPYIISSHFMPSTGWRLGTVVPESAILASVQETRNALDSTVKSMATRFTLLTILFLIVSIIVMAILAIKSFIRPLGKLSKGAQRVKEGDLTTHVDIDTKDEIGAVTQTFNNMVDTLREAKEREKEYTQALEQKVRDRTQEIVIKKENLEKTRERLELAMDAGEHGFWDWNLDTDDIYFSPRYYTMLGYEPDELPIKLKTWVDLMHPDDQKTIVPEIENYVKNARPYEIEFRLKTKDGDWKWISGRGKSYEKDSDGIPHRAVGVHVDISEKQKLETQLRQATKMEAIAILAGGVAHEFNNALMAVLGNIDLLKMDLPEDERRTKYFEAMNESGQRMSRLTAQLLAYSEGGKYNAKNLKLDDFVIETLPILQHDLNPEVRIETHFPKDILYIKADHTQIQMVLSAIVANSNEAIEDEGIIKIAAENKDIDEGFTKQHPGLKPGPHVCLTIKDNGKGMDEETKDGIFEPFFTTKFQGRGMGMAAVYGIIKSHDGAITIESEPGKGTVVRIYLPAISAESKQEAKEVKQPKVEIAKGEGTILVIEDEEPLVDLYSQILERLGYRVLVAMTGKEAVELTKTFDGQIDLALLDIKLPDMDGGRVYPLIMEARPDLKVIVCSGYSIHGPAQDILDAGAEGFIQKPFSIAPFAEKLKEVLEGKQAIKSDWSPCQLW